MDSKISKLIKLTNHAIALVHSDVCPEKVLQFKTGRWGCVIALLAAAAHRKIAAFSAETKTCVGGRARLDFGKYPLGWIEYFLSCGGAGVDRCERYKKSRRCA